MAITTGCSIIEYLAYAHAITANFGLQGGSVSKIKYKSSPEDGFFAQ